jgi:hypothetical protein
MQTLTCCASPQLNPESTDLGHADSFEFMLASCTQCGAYWMNVFCVANGRSGFEPVSAEDAATMLTLNALESGRERKEFMRNWAYEHT